MGRGRPKKDKDEFQDLPEEFKAVVVAKTDPDEIKKLIAEAAMNDVALRAAKKEDQHLKEVTEQKAEAELMYKDGAKQNKLKIEFCKRVLSDRGVSVPSIESFLKDNLE
jgi:secreted Zn-dependent insulinase-like peptidase